MNSRGGIEADVTVTRLAEDAYIVVTPAATVQRELSWMRRHINNDNVVIVDMTAGEGVLAIMGPNARKVLEKYLPETISNPQFSMAGGMTLAFVAGFDQTGELTAENLEKIEQELAALAK